VLKSGDDLDLVRVQTSLCCRCNRIVRLPSLFLLSFLHQVQPPRELPAVHLATKHTYCAAYHRIAGRTPRRSSGSLSPRCWHHDRGTSQHFDGTSVTVSSTFLPPSCRNEERVAYRSWPTMADRQDRMRTTSSVISDQRDPTSFQADGIAETGRNRQTSWHRPAPQYIHVGTSVLRDRSSTVGDKVYATD